MKEKFIINNLYIEVLNYNNINKHILQKQVVQERRNNMILNSEVEKLFKKHCKKNNLSEISKDLHLKKLNSLSKVPEVQARILKQSLDKDWKGLYPIKGE